MAHQIAIFIYDDFGALDIVGPADVFTTANQLAAEELYSSSTTTHDQAEFVTSESGLRFGIDSAISKLTSTQTLLVTGGLGFEQVVGDTAAIEEVARLADNAKRILSVCTGSFLLAEAGLLENRRATTHWAYANDFADAYPSTTLVADELYVTDGNVTTAAGVAAGIDLALAVLEADHGVELARAVSQRMVLYLKRAGGQSQFSERIDVPSPQGNSPLDELLAEISSSPSGDLSVATMAQRLSVSPRHFARLFRTRTGTTPAKWVERVRVDKARLLLETSDYPIDKVATESGFGSVDTMRQSFHRVLGISPSHYRTTQLEHSADAISVNHR